ncbi:MAG: hypothetical protein ACRDKX_04235 [Solirubrobacterales bacterium]
MRARILASYVILLALAGLVTVFGVRQVLLVRLDDRIEEDLEQEVHGEAAALGRPENQMRKLSASRQPR